MGGNVSPFALLMSVNQPESYSNYAMLKTGPTDPDTILFDNVNLNIKRKKNHNGTVSLENYDS